MPRSASRAGFASTERGVVVDHQVAGGAVTDLPQAHQQGFGTRQGERAAQPVYAFPALDLTDTGLARAQHDQLGAPEIERRGFGGRQHAAVVGAMQVGTRGAPGPNATRDRREAPGTSGAANGALGAKVMPLVVWSDAIASLRKKPCVATCRTRGPCREEQSGAVRRGARKQRHAEHSRDALSFGLRSRELRKLDLIQDRHALHSSGRVRRWGRSQRCRSLDWRAPRRARVRVAPRAPDAGDHDRWTSKRTTSPATSTARARRAARRRG